ncbi:MAG: molybdate ABC transporter substrate-binding protein, partial [Pseudomonadota bacterium]
MRVLKQGPMLVLAFCLWAVGKAQAADIRVAVAANFRGPMESLADSFAAETGYEISISAGSSGQLFAQIANGAPFDLFLSADQQRPARLIELGLAIPESRFTYAEGRLYLLMRDLKALDSTPPDLRSVRRISIANPRTAPYGAAALQVLETLDFPAEAPLLAEAQSIAGVNAAMAAGAVDAGFAAYSSVRTLSSEAPPGWLVPRDLHDPIRQDVVLLTRAADITAASALLTWLGLDTARGLIL